MTYDEMLAMVRGGAVARRKGWIFSKIFWDHGKRKLMIDMDDRELRAWFPTADERQASDWIVSE